MLDFVKHYRKYIYLIFFIGLAFRVSFVFSTGGWASTEMYQYLGESFVFSGVDGTKHYLGGTALGAYTASWRIPSLLFYNVNYLVIKMIGVYGLLLLIALMGSLATLVFLIFIKNLWPNEKTFHLLSYLLINLIPFNIFFSVGVWNPHYLSLFIISSMFFLYRVINDKKASGYYLIFASVSLWIAAQYHLTSYFYLPVYLFVLLFFPVRIKKIYYLLASLPWLLLLTSYFWFDYQNDFVNTNKIFYGMLGGKIASIFNNLNFLIGFASSGSNEISLYYGNELNLFYKKYFLIPAIPYFFNALNFLFIFYCIYWIGKIVFNKLKKERLFSLIKKYHKESFLCLWVMLPVLFLTLLLKGYHTRYALWVAPISVILQVWVFLKVLILKEGKFKTVYKYIGFASIIYLFVLNLSLIHYNHTEIILKGKPTTVLLTKLLNTMISDSSNRQGIPQLVTIPEQISTTKSNTAAINKYYQLDFTTKYISNRLPIANSSKKVEYFLRQISEKTAIKSNDISDNQKIAQIGIYKLFRKKQ